MDKIYDFSNDKLLNRPLGGTDRKNPVEHNGVAYMLKYTEVHAKKGDMSTSHLNSITSEYISSHISASTGLDTHHTLLGYRNGEAVVACQDFRQPYESNIEFGEYVRGLYTMEEIGRVLRLDQIYGTIKNASNIPEELKQPSIDRYWDTFVIDALVGNFDRHKGNWGYIAGPDDSLRLAPVYDFGSTLLPQLSDSGAKDIINDPFRMAERCLVFPSPALFIGTEKNGKPGYYDLLASGFDENCTRALLRMAPKINMDKMNQIIEETPFISNIKRIFYKKYIALRKALVIDRAYERCMNRDFDLDALNRIQSGNQYSKSMLAEDLKSGKLSFSFDTHTHLENELIVYAGIPGAGKNEAAQKYLYSSPGTAYIRTNDIREEMNHFRDENGLIDLSAKGCTLISSDVFENAYQRMRAALKDAKDVVFVATNLDKESRQRVLNAVHGIPDVRNHLVVIYQDPEKAKSDEPGNILRNKAIKLHNNPPQKEEGWDSIKILGIDPYRNRGYIPETPGFSDERSNKNADRDSFSR